MWVAFTEVLLQALLHYGSRVHPSRLHTPSMSSTAISDHDFKRFIGLLGITPDTYNGEDVSYAITGLRKVSKPVFNQASSAATESLA